jgi:hypothetical protein
VVEEKQVETLLEVLVEEVLDFLETVQQFQEVQEQ